jgi:hypothetical protein
VSRNKKDYIRNKFASEELADQLRDWWHRRGYTKVRVWVEEDRPISDFGTRLPANYVIRSNIVMNVDSIPNGMVE